MTKCPHKAQNTSTDHGQTQDCTEFESMLKKRRSNRAVYEGLGIGELTIAKRDFMGLLKLPYGSERVA